MTRAWALALIVGCGGCAPVVVGSGRDAATGAVLGITAPDAEAKLTALAAAATKAARDEALGPETNALLAGIVRTQVRQAVRAAVDEALAPRTATEAADFRESIFGPPLEKDLNDAIDSASPHLSQAVADAVRAGMAPLQADLASAKAGADAESQKWKPIAIGFAVGSALLLGCLGVAGWIIRGHRKTIRALRRKARSW